jgi:hypothetical protein
MNRGRALRFHDQAEFDAFRRSPSGYVSPTLRESDIQPSILEALRKHPLVAWAHRQNTAAGFLLDPPTYYALVKSGALQPKQARFIRFGWPGQLDNTGIMKDGRRLDVETKTASGKLTDDQEATIETCRAAGGVAFVARCVEDVFREIPL